MPERRLYLVRHGHTLWHESGRIAGRSDVALSDDGRASVDALLPSLHGMRSACRTDGRSIHWWTSPLERSVMTAQRLGGGIAAVRRDARLVELDFGDWEGSTWNLVHRESPKALARWAEDWVNRSPPNGESFAQQIERCRGWLAEYRGSDEEVVIVVAHGGTLRALLVCLLGLPPEQAMRFAIDPARVCRFDAGTGAIWRMRGWNLPGFDLIRTCRP